MGLELHVGSEVFSPQKITSLHAYFVQSMDGNELQYDTLDATVIAKDDGVGLFIPQDADMMLTDEDEIFLSAFDSVDMSQYKYGDVVKYLVDETILGKFYLSAIKRVGEGSYQLSCISGVGILDNSQHYGGIYTGQTVSQMLEDIIGDVVPYSVASELEGIPVYGWLPVSTRRGNLHQLLFAVAGAIGKDENGDIVVGLMADTSPESIQDNRIFLGGEIQYPQDVNRVTIAEHAFTQLASTEDTVLFEGVITADPITTPEGDQVTGAIVRLPAPCHTLIAENTTILEQGVNYAVLAPSLDCKLKGKEYVHTIREIVRPETGGAGTENTVAVADATLVSAANSENVADRMMSYYSSSKTVQCDIVAEAERAGDAVTLTDPFGDTVTGLIASMDVAGAGLRRASVDVIADYAPPQPGNTYNHVVVFETGGESVFEVPEGVTRIRVVLIAGGQGGQSGAPGEEGEGNLSTPGENGGLGGAKGLGGQSGPVYITTLAVEPGQEFELSLGTGGIGGSCTASGAGEGQSGTATLFGSLSSDLGTIPGAGYHDILTGDLYAVPGPQGDTDGGCGYAPEAIIEIDGVTYVQGATGNSDSDRGTGWSGAATGGGGGGPAAGADGEDGQDGEVDDNNGYGYAQGGEGGNGATATIPGAVGATPGSGGQGGNGGGGGGMGGTAEHTSSSRKAHGTGGTGGLGSDGGNGAPGCVIVYY